MNRGLFPFVVLLFIAFPIVEIALLITVGEKIGVLWTLLIVIGTALLGTSLLRIQGFGVLGRVNDAMSDGRLPVVPVMEGLFLLIAGAFLLTPGLITDTIGIILLIPTFRIAIARWVLERVLRGGFVYTQTKTTRSRVDDRPPEGRQPNKGPPPPRSSGSGTVIEGEFERIDETPKPSDRDPR